MKNVILMIINVLLISTFNVLFRYINVLNDLNNFNNNSSIIGSYITKSSTSVPYLKIFILSFLISIILFLLIVIILKNTTNSSYIKVISKLNNLTISIFMIVSIILLQFNTTASFIVLIIGFTIYIYLIYRSFECSKYIYLIYLIFVLYFLVLYYISF